MWIIRNTRYNLETLKFLKNLYQFKFGKYNKDVSAAAPYPPTLNIELTNKCNLHCEMCPREHPYGSQLSPGEMPTLLAKRIIDECYPYLQSVGLVGMGESLFASNLREVAEYIKSKKKTILVFISTNANFPDFIKRVTPMLPVIDTMQVSIDGIGDGYERIRKGGSFKLLDENLSRIVQPARDAGVDITLNMVVNKLNHRQMSDLMEYASEKGISYVNFNYVNLASIPEISVDYYDFFSTPEFHESLERVREAAKRHPEVEVTGLDYPGNPGIGKCPLMWNHLQVTIDGEIPPCCAKPFPKEYSFGNIKDFDGVKGVLNSKMTKTFRQTALDGKPHPFCKNCVFVNL